MPKWLRGVLGSTYAKIMFGGIVGFCGVVAGIYVGHAIIGQKTSPGSGPNPGGSYVTLDEKFVNFEVGDLFPLEDYTDSDGQQENFEYLLKDKKSILLFFSLHCGPCFDLLRFWQANLRQRLQPGVQVIACLNKNLSSIPDEYVGLVAGMHVVFYDVEYWHDTYDMAFWPTIIGVDESGFVTHIQFGYTGYIDYELINYFFLSNQ